MRMQSIVKNGVIRLCDLPGNLVYVSLSGPYTLKIMNTLRKLYGNWEKISKITKEDIHVFHNMLHGQKVHLNVIWKLSNILIKNGYKEYSKRIIERNVRILGTKSGNAQIYSPKLPFDFTTPSGCGFIAAIMFDGGIDNELKPHYANTHLSARQRVREYAVSIFGEMKHKEINPKHGFFIRFPKITGLILTYCFNMCCGKKVYRDIKIPDFIFLCSKKSKSTFLRQAFDDDGSVQVKGKSIYIANTIDVDRYLFFQKRMNKKAPRLYYDIIKLLSDFGIEPSLPKLRNQRILDSDHNKKGPFYRHAWVVYVTGRDNIEKFYKKINFNLKYKSIQIKNLLKSYKVHQNLKGMIQKIALYKAHTIEKQKGFFTKPLLTKELDNNYGYSYVTRIVRKLENNDLIKKITNWKAHGVGGGSSPAKFVLTKMGIGCLVKK